MSQFFNDHEIQNPGSKLINFGPEKIWRQKKLRIFKKMFFFCEKDSKALTSVNK